MRVLIAALSATLCGASGLAVAQTAGGTTAGGTTAGQTAAGGTVSQPGGGGTVAQPGTGGTVSQPGAQGTITGSGTGSGALNTNQPQGTTTPPAGTTLQPGTGGTTLSPATPPGGAFVPPAAQPGIQPPDAPARRNVNPADPTRMNPNIADPTTPNPNISGFTTGGQGAGTVVGAQPTQGTFVQGADGTIFFIPFFDAFNQQQQQGIDPMPDRIPEIGDEP